MLMPIFIIAFITPILLIFLAYLLNFRSMMSRMKLSPFECGFEPMNFSRIPFSMRFFMLVIIFMVFDIEIMLLLPLPTMWNMNFMLPNFMILGFLSILLLGLIHELTEGTISWAK
nr:TPA: NADH dehydrogenase subunit 3 [Bdellodrilus illuminatus]